MDIKELKKVREKIESELLALDSLEEFCDEIVFDSKLIKVDKDYRIPNDEVNRLKKLAEKSKKLRDLFDNRQELLKYASGKDQSKKLELKPSPNMEQEYNTNFSSYKVIEIKNVYFIMEAYKKFNNYNKTEKQHKTINAYRLLKILKFGENGEKITIRDSCIEIQKSDLKVFFNPTSSDDYSLEHKNANKRYSFYSNGEYSCTPLNYEKYCSLSKLNFYDILRVPFFYDKDHKMIAEGVFIKLKDDINIIVNVVEKSSYIYEKLNIPKNGPSFSCASYVKFAFSLPEQRGMSFKKTEESEEFIEIISGLSEDVLFGMGLYQAHYKLDEYLLENTNELRNLITASLKT